MPDEYADAHVFAVLRSMCDPENQGPIPVPEGRIPIIHEYLVRCGLDDGTGKPTEPAYDLWYRIPVKRLGTLDIGGGRSVTAVCIKGYMPTEERESAIEESDLIVACIVDGSIRIFGTYNTDIAGNIGWIIGKSDVESGDLILAAVADDAFSSIDSALSVALRIA